MDGTENKAEIYTELDRKGEVLRFDPSEPFTGEHEGIFFNVSGGTIYGGAAVKCPSVYPRPVFFYNVEIYPHAAASALQDAIKMKNPEAKTIEDYKEALRASQEHNGIRIFSDTAKNPAKARPCKYIVFRYSPEVTPIPRIKFDIIEDFLEYMDSMEEPLDAKKASILEMNSFVAAAGEYFRDLVLMQRKFKDPEELFRYELESRVSLWDFAPDYEKSDIMREYFVTQTIFMSDYRPELMNGRYAAEYFKVIKSEELQDKIRHQSRHLGRLLDQHLKAREAYKQLLEEYGLPPLNEDFTEEELLEAGKEWEAEHDKKE